MKILTVVYSLEKGGTQRAAQNFADGYLINGHDSRLLATKHDGIRRTELATSGVYVWLYINEMVLTEIKEWQPDLIHLHSHGLTMDEVTAILDCAKFSKVIETNVFSQPSPWADLVHNSYQLSEWCQWLYQKRSSKLLSSNVVPYPIRTDSFNRASDEDIYSFRKKYGINSEEILIGRIGQAFEGKWSPLLINSYNRLKSLSSKFRLLLVNPPDSIKTLALHSNFKDSIVIIDTIIGDNNLAIAYSAIDIFVLVADQGESFGMVLAEAMLCETPVVAFSTPWGDNSQCEVVGNMKGGLVVTTAKGLDNAVLQLAYKPDMRSIMGKAGREKVILDYDYRKLATQSIEHIKLHRNFQSSKSVPNVYFEAFDQPNYISLMLLRRGLYLNCLKYLTGYESLNTLPKRLGAKIKRIIISLSILKKLNNS